MARKYGIGYKTGRNYGRNSDPNAIKNGSFYINIAPKRSIFRKVPPTEFGSAMGGLTVGMLIIFPILALLLIGSFTTWLVVVGIFALLGLVLTQDFVVAGIMAGAMAVFTLLGFISLGFYMIIFGGI